VIVWLACSTPCPEGAADPAREARIEALVGELPPLCFGGRSVQSGEVLLLEDSEPDEALGAKARHLALHAEQGPDPSGPDCLEQWMAREEEAWALEADWRRRLGLDEGHGMPATLEAEYAERCSQ